MKKEISLKELESYLNTLLNSTMFDEKSYNGVQVETKVPIKKIATAVSISKEVIQKAVQEQIQALIVHHGIFSKGDAHPLRGRLYDYISLLITHNIALLCYHLPLDAHQEVGNNCKAAQDLGLKNLEPFLWFAGTPMGVIGTANESFDSFMNKASKLYGRTPNYVKVHDQVKKVAIVSGGADKVVRDVAYAGANCFITGRVDEPVWDDAREYGVSFLGFGHYATETIGPKALALQIENYFKIPTIFIKTDNPF